jgi:hypothetical protein
MEMSSLLPVKTLVRKLETDEVAAKKRQQLLEANRRAAAAILSQISQVSYITQSKKDTPPI